MEGIKSDRPFWINKIERQFAEDIRYSKDPTTNILNQYIAMETERVPLEELEINLTLVKNPKQYSKNSLQRLLGNELEADEGDSIKYYKSDIIGGGTSNPRLISRRKYLEMLRTTVGDSIQAMGYDFDKDIVGEKRLYGEQDS